MGCFIRGNFAAAQLMFLPENFVDGIVSIG